MFSYDEQNKLKYHQKSVRNLTVEINKVIQKIID